MQRCTRIALISALLAAAPITGASEPSLSLRATTGVGALIAQQGNAALLEIRNEVRSNLLAHFKPKLPPREPRIQSAPVVTAPPAP